MNALGVQACDASIRSPPRRRILSQSRLAHGDSIFTHRHRLAVLSARSAERDRGDERQQHRAHAPKRTAPRARHPIARRHHARSRERARRSTRVALARHPRRVPLAAPAVGECHAAAFRMGVHRAEEEHESSRSRVINQRCRPYTTFQNSHQMRDHAVPACNSFDARRDARPTRGQSAPRGEVRACTG